LIAPDGLTRVDRRTSAGAIEQPDAAKSVLIMVVP
jgi:hypothetical protein